MKRIRNLRVRLKRSRSRNVVWFVVLVLLAMVVVWQMHYWSRQLDDDAVPAVSAVQTYLLNTSRCQIPYVFTNDYPQYPAKAVPLVCGIPVEMAVNQETVNALVYTMEVLGPNVTCSYSVLARHDDFHTSWTVESVAINQTVVVIPYEFVQVECENPENELMFDEFFAFIQRKPEVEERCRLAERNRPSGFEPEEQLSVLILVIHSASRGFFVRHMQKTNTFFRQFTSLVDLKGFSSMSTSALPFLVSLLSGQLPESFNLTHNTLFDDFPFIWKEFAERGYRTLFSEDKAYPGSFQQWNRGFNVSPTDYYFRPLSVAGHDKSMTFSSAAGCIKSQNEAALLLRWTLHLFQVFHPKPVFALNVLSLLTTISVSRLHHYDEEVFKFFHALYTQNHLNRSVVLLLGDHGPLSGRHLRTYAGRMESRLPLFYLLLPTWFAAKHPEWMSNVMMNARRLVTVLDVHATLRDILALPTRASGGRGLFRSVMREERTCQDARIPDLLCACSSKEELTVIDQKVVLAAKSLVKAVNRMTLKWRKMCSRFSLHEIVNISYLESEAPYFKTSYLYHLTVSVWPGRAVFKGSVFYLTEARSFATQPLVERVGPPGEEAVCARKLLVQPFCYCRSRFF